MKKNSFIGGAFVATLGIIIVKVIGLLYVIPFNESSLDLTPFVYEYVTLEKPMRCVHGETEGNTQFCNKEVIEILEKPIEEVEKETDSRWDALKNLKF